jgi:lipoyl(octanoyl) transferase
MALDIEHVGFGPPLGDGYVDYQWAWSLQQEVHGEVASGGRGDTVLLLEHASVYTAGKRTNSWERPTDGTPVVDVDRGGRITWHGPGQIVGYPITRLPDPVDVVAYVRRVEQLLIDTCAQFGVDMDRVEGRSGVWVLGNGVAPDRKVGAIGVRVARGVTMHGFALNIENSLSAYQQIVPCGIEDAEVTTLSIERERLGLGPVTVADALPVLEQKLPALTGVPAPSGEVVA